MEEMASVARAQVFGAFCGAVVAGASSRLLAVYYLSVDVEAFCEPVAPVHWQPYWDGATVGVASCDLEVPADARGFVPWVAGLLCASWETPVDD